LGSPKAAIDQVRLCSSASFCSPSAAAFAVKSCWTTHPGVLPFVFLSAESGVNAQVAQSPFDTQMPL
jgi:hypothetical protein